MAKTEQERSGSRWATRIKVIAMVAVVGAIVLLLSACNQSSDDAQKSGQYTSLSGNTSQDGGGSGTAPRVGAVAPDFTVKGLDGQEIRLSDLRGKAVWLNFWATWCPPCRAEMPDINTVAKQKAGDGLVVLAISQGEEAATVQRFIEDNHYDGIKVGLDPDQSVGNQYRVLGIPTHYFIDKNGVIRDMVVGGLNRSQMLQKVGKILGQ